MQKKILSLALALAICLGLTVSAMAYDVDKSGWIYEFSNAPIGTVQIDGNWRGQITVYIVPDNTVVTCKTAPDAFLDAGMLSLDEDDDGNPYVMSEGAYGEGSSFEVIPYGPQFVGVVPVFFDVVSYDETLQNLIDTEQVRYNDVNIYVAAESAAKDLGWTVQAPAPAPTTPAETTPAETTPAYEHESDGYVYGLSNAPTGVVMVYSEEGDTRIFVVPDNTLVTCETVPSKSMLYTVVIVNDAGEYEITAQYYTEAGAPFKVAPTNGGASVVYQLWTEAVLEGKEVLPDEGNIAVVAQSAAAALGLSVQSLDSAAAPAPSAPAEPAPSAPSAPAAGTPAKAVLSPQNLSVDGKVIECEKYNIDGRNYFKLRDLAYVLNGTGSQFEVGFENNTVTITTGAAYTTANGTELVVGADNAATAQTSAQTIMIDGAVRSDLTVYNIGGSNFFQLRELGDALGFTVDFDAATNTAIVLSK